MEPNPAWLWTFEVHLFASQIEEPEHRRKWRMYVHELEINPAKLAEARAGLLQHLSEFRRAAATPQRFLGRTTEIELYLVTLVTMERFLRDPAWVTAIRLEAEQIAAATRSVRMGLYHADGAPVTIFA